MNKLIKAITRPDRAMLYLIDTPIGRLIPDKLYLQIKFRLSVGRKLDLKNPKTLNEKLQWLKLYNRREKHITLVDKYAARDYIAKTLGEEYLIPLLGVWDSPEEIDFDSLPDKFVLKCNHNSGGGMCVCKDKSKLDVKKAKSKLATGLKEKYFYSGREWPYKHVKPRIVGEKYMTDSPDVDCFTDYKFYCFGGNVDSVMVCIERNTGNPKFYFFDKDWQLKRYNKRGKEAPEGFTLPKPENMDKMFQIAETLSKDCEAPYVRVDLYNSNGKIYFGELTFYPDSGFDPNRLPETDLYFGSLTKLN